MSAIGFLLELFAERAAADAVVWKDRTCSYGELLSCIERERLALARGGIGPGTVCALEADFSPNGIAAFLAAIETGCIVVPLTPAVEAQKPELLAAAQAERRILVDADDRVTIEGLGHLAAHPLYDGLRRAGSPGLVLFTSGTTGFPKAAVHDLTRLLVKYKTRRHDLRSLAFLMFDHIGGIDTLFYCLSNASCLITVDDRSPEQICRTVERHRVEVLPVSPTFLNFLLLSQAHQRYDLSSLRFVTYGAEVMPPSTIARCAEIFPGVKLLQKFGTTEVGTLRSQSRGNDSVWVRLGGDGFDVRVVDGILQIKAGGAMLGYLNAPSPFTADGWFVTGDVVEQDGEYMHILGRATDVINVGGEKVFPGEVEGVIQELEEVAEVAVFGESHPLMGQIVCARVVPAVERDRVELTALIKRHCRQHLPAYKIPAKLTLTDEVQHGIRHKKRRA